MEGNDVGIDNNFEDMAVANVDYLNYELGAAVKDKLKLQADVASELAKSEDRKKLALQAEAMYMEVENEVEMLSMTLKRIQKHIQQLSNEEGSIEEQLEMMREGSGMCFWPKPLVQLEKPVEEVPRNVLIIGACGYCDSIFEFNDIAVTSCKHAFHPFCLGVMLKSSRKCLVCKQDLHPNWWSSWGFSEGDEGLQALAAALDIEGSRKKAIASIRAAAMSGLNVFPGKHFVGVFRT